MIFGYANLFVAVLCFLMPMSAFYDYRLLIIFRVTQGLLFVNFRFYFFECFCFQAIFFLGIELACNA